MSQEFIPGLSVKVVDSKIPGEIEGLVSRLLLDQTLFTVGKVDAV